MTRYFIILLCGIFLMSCSPKRAKNLPPAEYIETLNLMSNVAVQEINLPDTIITPPRLVLKMERKSCIIGKCPAYKVEFFDNGFVRYEGKSYVDKYGQYETQITDKELTTLLLLAKNIDYFEFENVYPTSGKIIYELPETVTFVKYYSEINYIENHHNAPVPLIRFEEHIEELIDNLEWKQIE